MLWSRCGDGGGEGRHIAIAASRQLDQVPARRSNAFSPAPVPVPMCQIARALPDLT